eukprot:TRINITY_DN37589_c0_g1_i1.p1 TRINITY_DN37589_c0_g1~~TRINITY_DN37589_c0_g1_i1.p1  ORF type:complete len:157 (-),score=19.64 TRINITY_DN37589_c0_g1_i1:133-603(-)
MFELGVVNILQDRVKSSMRGRAVIFYELSYVLSMVGMDVLSVLFHKKEEFWILCTVSVITTVCGCLLFLSSIQILCAKKSNDPGSEIPVGEYQNTKSPPRKAGSFKRAVLKVQASQRFGRLSRLTVQRASIAPQALYDADLQPLLDLHGEYSDDSD